MSGTAGRDGGERDDGSEWRFGVDEVGEDGEDAEESVADPIEPESPSAENVAFFVLGVVATAAALGLLIFG